MFNARNHARTDPPVITLMFLSLGPFQTIFVSIFPAEHAPDSLNCAPLFSGRLFVTATHEAEHPR